FPSRQTVRRQQPDHPADHLAALRPRVRPRPALHRRRTGQARWVEAALMLDEFWLSWSGIESALPLPVLHGERRRRPTAAVLPLFKKRRCEASAMGEGPQTGICGNSPSPELLRRASALPSNSTSPRWGEVKQAHLAKLSPGSSDRLALNACF